MFEYINITKRYSTDNGTVTAVDSVGLQVEAGTLCVLLGPSGCGKTTLLRMANRLVEPTSGEIRIDGKNILGEDPVTLRRRIGYVIQSVGLFPHRTVEENVATTLELVGAGKEHINRRTNELLEMMQLDPARYRKRYPAELSGGEQQRVGVARALAADPPLLLMDEPFGAIDPINRGEIQQQFLALQRELKKTILFVSHDIQEALLLADTVALMNKGKLVQHAPPAELLQRPADEFVERFFGEDRGMYLLQTTHVADVLEQGMPNAPTETTIPRNATLRRALLLLLERGAEQLPVVDDAGNTVGVVSLNSIRALTARARTSGGNV